jgi:hypothetical protein
MTVPMMLLLWASTVVAMESGAAGGTETETTTATTTITPAVRTGSGSVYDTAVVGSVLVVPSPPQVPVPAVPDPKPIAFPPPLAKRQPTLAPMPAAKAAPPTSRPSLQPSMRPSKNQDFNVDNILDGDYEIKKLLGVSSSLRRIPATALVLSVSSTALAALTLL